MHNLRALLERSGKVKTNSSRGKSVGNKFALFSFYIIYSGYFMSFLSSSMRAFSELIKREKLKLLTGIVSSVWLISVLNNGLVEAQQLAPAPSATNAVTTISGVVTVGGTPTNSAFVFVSGTSRRISLRPNGSFQVTVPGPGQYFVSALPKGKVLTQPITQSVTVTTGSNNPISLDLKRISGTNSLIFGRVVSEGLPVAQAKVRLYDSKEVLTDQNGIYTSGEISAGRYYMAINLTGATFSKPFRQVLLKASSLRREDFSAASFPNNFAILKNGLYDFKVVTNTGTCNVANLNLQGVASVSQVRDRLSIQLPSLGVFNTRLINSAFSVNLQKRANLCRVSGPVTGTFDATSKALVQADFSVQCVGQPACAIKVNGELTPKM